MAESDRRNTSEQKMKGQVALITGASRGIGAATAKMFAANGAAVGINYYRSHQQAVQLVAEIEAVGGNALAVQASVNDPGEVEAMVKEVEKTLGPIETLVMNAALVPHFTVGSFLEYEWQMFQETALGELAGVYFPAKAVAPLMIERKHGNMIVVGSSTLRIPWEGSIAHATGKSGVEGMVKALVQELGPRGIRVNIVAPGLIETDANAHWTPERKQPVARLAPLRRLGTPEDVAGAIFLLALDEAKYITGSYLTVNGGLSMP